MKRMAETAIPSSTKTLVRPSASTSAFSAVRAVARGFPALRRRAGIVVPSSHIRRSNQLEHPMAKRRPRNTTHAEGDHGPKTQSHIAKQLHSSPPEQAIEERLEEQRSDNAFSGKRRLVEDRQQHDEG